jgi:cyanophycinase
LKPIYMTGWIALIGGNEFRSTCESMDRALLTHLGKKPKVAILPTAAKENPSMAAGNGVRYFQKLGAEATGVMILDRKGAQNPALISKLEDADLLYFPGGDPIYLLMVLKDSPAWKAVVKLWQRGRMLAGSSAGAMVMGEKMWNPDGGWREGLGITPGIAIVPHHATLGARWDVHKMRASLPDSVTLVGIDEATALAGPPWKVLGIGGVTLYKTNPSSPSPSVFIHGQEVIL